MSGAEAFINFTNLIGFCFDPQNTLAVAASSFSFLAFLYLEDNY
jgi:hypothetical protein